VGAGISIWSNAIRALNGLGLGDAVRARIRFPRYSDVRTSRGAILSASASEESVGVMHRADLLSIFIGALDSERLHLDHECVGFQDASGVTAQFSNGSASRGGVLIGADGLHSVVRGALFGKSAPRNSGYTAWRSVATFGGTSPRAKYGDAAAGSVLFPCGTAESIGLPPRMPRKASEIPRARRSSICCICSAAGNIRSSN
jgi:2-polyprenyl-6-methoxyphenol hydroxylase-like FAD-dependent oxidoreductase